MMHTLRKWFPIIISSALFIFAGDYGKLSGSERAIFIFTDLNILATGESFGRILAGSIQLLIGVFLWIRPLRRPAAMLGSAIMITTLWYHISAPVFEFPILASINLVFIMWILLRRPTKSYKK